MPPELFYLLCALLNVTPFALVFNGKLTLSLIFVLLNALSLPIFKVYLFSLLLLSFSLYIDIMVVLGRASWPEDAWKGRTAYSIEAGKQKAASQEPGPNSLKGMHNLPHHISVTPPNYELISTKILMKSEPSYSSYLLLT